MEGIVDQEVFDFTSTREYDDVVAEAKKKGEKIWEFTSNVRCLTMGRLLWVLPRGVDIPCLLTRMVGLFRLHQFTRRPRKRKSTKLIAAVFRLRLRAYS